ncbi:MAG: N-formylglutamate amidohydrolase [Rhodospirillales bacterium]|nr:N-formylglutamate amidohydrolase [Rhodospirillales bacterium]MBO6788585.1 N-formylglutamate amidohydrolase [Rhodospirillales bacterium]
MAEPVVVIRPAAGTSPLPLVFDSPHSGLEYPADMKPSLDMDILRRSEDAFVDALFGHVPVLGAVLVKATFPRCYIDPNRTTEDIETAALADTWSGPVQTSVKTARGTGLVWTKIGGVHPIYDRKLYAAEVQTRIDQYWRPYHETLDAEMDALHAAFGALWHINCHSMPARGDETTEDGPVDRADFVLGDRDGTTCEPAFTETVRDFLAGRGYDVAVNWPMKGVELVRKHGRPAENRHSLQIEVNRRLYMDEAAITKNDRYPETAQTIADMNAAIADFVRAHGNA